MFSTGFQSIAFQSVYGGSQQSGGTPERFTYVPAYQRQEAERRQKIKKTKTEIDKVQSVISEYERRKALAEESLLIAREKERVRLLSVQNELLEEINRLLTVKAELVARMKRDEEHLITMVIMRRRRFRAF